ncbi:hypothetical protein Agub_g9105 [Astrephomene gubernaculifera]|uniref:tRNA(His) guanylyltransferase n=1 Tax=Astrephomene gubernaculifera TaxID=47775 RepID=A0AAD3HN04_9CHLO|nr:hypothetical protein Agub_g9105 [Astrephomene gubernaculifera]
MDECAKEVMNEFPDVRLAYGESDEYSFVLGRDTDMYGRRASKIVSLLVSCFTATYVARWSAHLPDTPLRATPMFDGRAVCYPLDRHLRDYLAWRQADTHINNQYNTCFWALVKGGKSPAEAQAVLRGTQAAFKNELLFRDFGINYAHLPDQFKKASPSLRGSKRKKAVTGCNGKGQVRFTRAALLVAILDINVITGTTTISAPYHVLRCSSSRTGVSLLRVSGRQHTLGLYACVLSPKPRTCFPFNSLPDS